MLRTILCAIALAWPCATFGTLAQDGEEAIAWRANTFALDPNGEAAEGEPGWVWLEERAAGAQFILFGEQHYVAGIARTVETGYGRVQPQGFDAIALEASPWLARRMNADGVTATLTDYPYELAFRVDGMVSLFRAVEAQAGSPSDAFWGLDQPVTAIHGYQALGETLPTGAARRMARGLSRKASLQFGEYLRHPHDDDIDALRAAAGRVGSEVRHSSGKKKRRAKGLAEGGETGGRRGAVPRTGRTGLRSCSN